MCGNDNKTSWKPGHLGFNGLISPNFDDGSIST
jgi:hypothetical protein